ncbi:MAG: DUF2147 domain-containing protein [Desulfobacterales bacterium]|nr:DUF2147 domain-containing protein [Desulfobacterales bacterium]
MKKHLAASLLGILISLCITSLALAQAPILGKWKTIDDETNQPKSIVEIFERDGKYYGKITRLFIKAGDNPNPLCDKCDDGDPRKDQPIQGMEIIKDMQPNGEKFSQGTILDPKKGKAYKCKLWVEDGKLQVQGSFLFISRTQTWHRTE